MHSAGAPLMWHFLELNDLDGKLTHKGIFLFGTFLSFTQSKHTSKLFSKAKLWISLTD